MFEDCDLFPCVVSTMRLKVRGRSNAVSSGMEFDSGCPAVATLTVVIGLSSLRISTCARLLAAEPSIFRAGFVQVRTRKCPCCITERSLTASGIRMNGGRGGASFPQPVSSKKKRNEGKEEFEIGRILHLRSEITNLRLDGPI